MDAVIRPYKCGEQKYVAEAHRRIYAGEYRWGGSFTDYAAKIALDYAKKQPDTGEELWVAELDGRLVGCIMLCRTSEPDIGQLRLFLVEKEYRGNGIGSALLAALMRKAKTSHYSKLILWTASPLLEAIKQYEKLGFTFQAEVENTDWSISGETIKEIKMEKVLNNSSTSPEL